MSETNDNKLVPKLRFPLFINEKGWEEKPLEDVAVFLKGKGISKSDIAASGKQPCIRYGELYTHYKEIIDSTISYTDLPLEDLILSEANDVIIPSSGETQEDIATASCVIRKGIALGGDLNILRSKVNGIFLSYYLTHIKKKAIAKIAQGNAVVHLYSSQLKKLQINIPQNITEQQKIADCLSSLDEVITAEKQKLEVLKEHKKGLLQNLFPQEGETVPKLRFKEFEDSGEWVEKTLGMVAEKRVRKNKNTTVREVFTNSANAGIVNQRDYFDKDIANQNNLEGYYIVEKDDFIYNPRISNAAPVGPISRNKIGVGVMSPLYSVFKFLEGNLDYIEHFFATNIWHKYMKDIGNQGARADRMSFSVANFYEMPILFPRNPKEQQKIASCLSSSEDLINTQSQKVETLKLHKKGLLQGLFPITTDEI